MPSIVQRTISKSLIVHNDLALGVGEVEQTRQGIANDEQLIELSFIFRTIVEIRALDEFLYTRVQLHQLGINREYWYNPDSSAADDGLRVLKPDSNPATGRWLLTGFLAQATKTFNPASISAGASLIENLTIVGAALGDFTIVSFALDLQGMALTSYVVSTDTVVCLFRNYTGSPINLASAQLAGQVFIL